MLVRFAGLVVLTLWSFPALAQDATTDPRQWWQPLVFGIIDALWKLAIPVFIGWLMKKAGDDRAKQEAVRALEAGVQDAWVGFVKEAKKQAADGKWTEEEKQAAREWAFNKARDLAKGAGLRLLSAWARPYVDSLIGRIVEKRKREAAK